jgi:transglutaminase-like putative cysteine protease
MSYRLRLAAATALALALSLSAFGSLFRTAGFTGPLLVTVLLVIAGGELSRLVRLPAAVGPLLSAALCLGWVTLLYGGRHAFLRVIPTGRSLARLDAVATAGFAAIRRYATPVPDTHGLFLLCIAGVFGVALVAYLLAVTLHRPAAAGLPILALYATAAAVSRHGLGWMAFVLGALGYLFLLGADAGHRLVHWGRLISPSRSDDPSRPFVGGRIGLTAIVVALLLPLLIPALHAHRLTSGRPNGGSGGCVCAGMGLTYDPLLRIGSSLKQGVNTPLYVVRESGTEPQYLQLTTLDAYTGGSWLQAARPNGPLLSESPIPPPAVRVPARRFVARVSLLGQLRDPWLPVPNPVTQVSVDGDWRYDATTGTVFSPDETSEDLTNYLVVGLQPDPSAAALAAASGPFPTSIRRADLQLPRTLPSVIRQIAVRVTAGQTTEYGKALALQDYLRSKPFRYSQAVPDRDGERALVDFLTRTHAGYCVQYAAAMAVLARSIGLPARVAVGFTGGTRQGKHSFLVGTQDAHAWPQLYFPGAGWLRFEPTPGGEGNATVPDYAGAGSGGGGSTGSGSGPKTHPAHQPSPKPTTPPISSRIQRGGGAAKRIGNGPLALGDKHHRSGGVGGTVVLALLILLLVAAAGPGLGRLAVRRRRLATRQPDRLAEGAWREVLQTAADLGVDLPAGASARRAAAALTRRGRLRAADAVQLDSLLDAVERFRYGAPGAAGDVTPDRLLGAATAVRRGLLRAAAPRRRWAARLAPVTVFGWLGWAVGTVASIPGRAFDAAVAAAALRLRRIAGRRGAGGRLGAGRPLADGGRPQAAHPHAAE